VDAIAWRCEEPGGTPGRSRHCVRDAAPGSQELGRREPSNRSGTLNPVEVMQMQVDVPPASGSTRDFAAS
jgi:hypothetical protein